MTPSARWSSAPTPPEAITGMLTASATARVSARSKPDLVPSRSMLVGTGGDVEEGNFIGALVIVFFGDFDRVAGVAQVDEIDALDHAAGVDVQTGDDAFCQHGVLGKADAGYTAREVNVANGRGLFIGRVGDVAAFPEVELAFVNRTAGNGAHDALGFHRHQALDVVEVVEAAAGDHRNGQRLRQLHGGVDVHAGQHAVAADVGVEHGFDAVILEAYRQIDHIMSGQLGP